MIPMSNSTAGSFPVGLPCPNWHIIPGFYLRVKLPPQAPTLRRRCPDPESASGPAQAPTLRSAQAEICVRTGIGGPVPVRIAIPFASANHVAVQAGIGAIPGHQPVISRTQLHRCRKSVLILLLSYPRFNADLIARGQQTPDRIRIICMELQIACGTAV